MSVNDPIADFLTRIRNAGMVKHETVEMPHSKMKAEMARILKEQGYINDYSEKGAGAKKKLVIELKYGPDGQRAITGLRRMSRPGRRVYRKQTNIPVSSTAWGWRSSRPRVASSPTTRPDVPASAARSFASSIRGLLEDVENR